MLDLIIVIEYDIQISFIYVGSGRAVADSWPHLISSQPLIFVEDFAESQKSNKPTEPYIALQSAQ